MQKTIYILLLSVLTAMASCERNSTEKMLSSVDSLCMTNPDSALKILDGIDRNGLSSQGLAHYCFVYTKSQDKADIIVKDDSLIRIAYDYYRQHSDEQPYAQTMYYMGKYYANLDSTKQSEDCLLASIKAAKERDEYYTAYLGLNKLSKVIRETNPKSALGYAKEALKYYELISDSTFTSNKVYSLENLGRCYMFAQDIDSAIILYEKAMDCAIEIGDSGLICEVAMNKGYMFAYYQHFDKALACAKQAVNNNNNPSSTLQYLLFHCYGSLGLYDEAIETIEKIKFATDNMQYSKYLHLLSYAISLHDYDKANEYKDSLHYYVNCLYYKNQSTNGIYIDDNIKKSEEIGTLNNNIKQLTIGTILLLLVATIIGLVWYYPTKMKKQKLEAEAKEIRKECDFKELQLQKSSEELTMLQGNLEELHKHKEAEVSELTMQVEELQERFRNLPITNQVCVLLNEDIVKRFLEMSNQINVKPSKSDWDKLLTTIYRYFPTWKAAVRDKGLSPLREKMCAAALIGIPTKELGNMINGPKQMVSNTKRLANKDIFDDNSASTLHDNIIDYLKSHPQKP